MKSEGIHNTLPNKDRFRKCHLLHQGRLLVVYLMIEQVQDF